MDEQDEVTYDFWWQMEMGIEKTVLGNISLEKDSKPQWIWEVSAEPAVLYSATILREAIEDEIEAEKVAKEQNPTLPECKIMSCVISATKYPYTDEDGWAFRGKICVSSYCKGQVASLKVMLYK